jgi:hypothetical protein
VYVLELDRSHGGVRAGPLHKITNIQTPGTGAYYPSFTKDGRVVYVLGERNNNNEVRYSFRTVNPMLSPPIPSSIITGACATCGPQRAAALALGALWVGVCTKLGDQLTVTDATLWALGLDSAACHRLVQEKWSGERNRIVRDTRLQRVGVAYADVYNLTQASVEAACPPPVAARRPTRVVEAPANATTVRVNQTGQEIFQSRCLSCHSGGNAVHFDWNHLSLDEVNNMLIAIDNGTMPREAIPDRENELHPLVESLRVKRRELEAQQP